MFFAIHLISVIYDFIHYILNKSNARSHKFLAKHD